MNFWNRRRIGRLDFLRIHMLALLISFNLGGSILVFAGRSAGGYLNLLGLVTIYVLLLSFATITTTAAIKRLQDMGKSSLYLVLYLFPLTSIGAFVYLLFTPGNPHINRYGSGKSKRHSRIFQVNFAVNLLFMPAMFWLLALNPVTAISGIQDESGRLVFFGLSDRPLWQATAKGTPQLEVRRQRLLDLYNQVNKQPCDSETAYRLSRSLLQEKRYGEQQRLNERYEKICGNYDARLMAHAFRSAKMQNNLSIAESKISRLIEDFPENEAFLVWRGLLYQQWRRHDRAIQDFEEVLRIAPDIKGVPLNLVSLYEAGQKSCNALRILNQYAEKYPIIDQQQEIIQRRQQLRQACFGSI